MKSLKKKKPASVDLLNTPENMEDTDIAKTFLNTTTILEAKSRQSEKHTEVANGERDSDTNASVNSDSTLSKMRKKKKNKPASVDLLNTPETMEDTEVAKTLLSTTTILEAKSRQSEKHMEVANGERDSDTNAAINSDSTLSKKRKKKKNKPASVELLNTPETMEDTEVAKTFLSTTTILEAKSRQSGKHMEVANGERDSDTNAAINSDSTLSKKRKKKKNKPASVDLLNTPETMEDTEVAKTFLSTTTILEAKSRQSEKHMEVANGERDSDTNAAINSDITLSKKRKKKKNKPASVDLLNTPENMEDTEVAKAVLGTTIISEAKSMQSEIANGESGSGTTATFDAKSTVSKKRKEKKMKPASDVHLNSPENMEETGVAKTALGTTTILEAKSSESKMHTQIANGERGSLNAAFNADDRVSKKRKRKSLKNQNPASDDLLNTPENMEVTEAAKVAHVVVAKKTESEREESMKIAKGGSSTTTTTTVNANSTESLKKKKISKTRRETMGEILNPRYSDTPENMEDTDVAKMVLGTTAIVEAKSSESKLHKKRASDERGSGMTAAFDANNTASKKRKRKSSKNQNPASDDLLNTPENMEVTEVANGTQLEKHMEISNDETGPSKSATRDANSIMSKREGHTKITNGETGSGTTATNDVKTGSKKVANDTGSSATTTHVVVATKIESERDESMKIAEGDSSTTTTVNANSTESLKKKKKRSQPRRATMGVLDPRYSEIPLEIANTECKSSNKTRKQKLIEKKLDSGDILNTHENIKYMDIANNELGGTLPIEKVRMPSHVHGSQQMDTNVARPLSGSTTLRKKLIIFDLNGLLVDIVSPPPRDLKADGHFLRRAIFKRPFLDEFLCFCFERFEVGIWTSRTKKVLDRLVAFLLRDWKEKFLFIWNAYHCTNSGKRTLEDKYKPLVLKKLSKIWKKYKDYDESNTLLLDDSPYKALVNPKHTGIFPSSYSYKDKNDNSLGPEGDLRVYLEGVAAAEDVRAYVEQHPLGQRPIDETSPHWSFYSKILKRQQDKFTSPLLPR